MATQPKFIAVGDMLADVAAGLGRGHRQLVEASRTALATLVVKDATVKVEFELSSSATQRSDSASVQGPVLGAKTLSLGVGSDTTAAEQRALNRATITLNIVSVLDPPAAEAPPPKPPPPAPPPPIGPVPAPPAIDPGKLTNAIGALKEALAKARLSAARRRELSALLGRADALAAKGDVAGATALLADFTQRMKALAGGKGGR